MSRTVNVRFQPMMIERMTAGAEMIVPQDKPRDSRNSALVNVRVLSQALGVEPDAIARRTASTTSFVELYGQFLR